MSSHDLSEANVLHTDHGDGSADFTVSFADDDYKFSASAENGAAIVEYEETLTWRGSIVAKEPDDEIFKALMVSDEMTEFLENNGIDRVKRNKR